MERGVSSLGDEGRNYGGCGEIYVRNFRFVPQKFGGVILLIESKLTPPNGSCAQDAVGTGVADQYRHLLVCFAESQKHFTFGVFRGVQTCTVEGVGGYRPDPSTGAKPSRKNHRGPPTPGTGLYPLMRVKPVPHNPYGKGP